MDQYKYNKKIHKGWNKKVSDGNYGSMDEMGSITIAVNFDNPDDYGKMLEDIYQMKDLDDELIAFLDNKKDVMITIKAQPEQDVVLHNEKTDPPPRPTGNGISSYEPVGDLSLDQYNTVGEFLESIGFTAKTWPDGNTSYSRKNDAGDYVAFALTRDKSRYGCKIGGEWYKPHAFGDVTDKLVSNVTKVWEKETSN